MLSTRCSRIVGRFKARSFLIPTTPRLTKPTTTGFAIMMRRIDHGPRSSPSCSGFTVSVCAGFARSDGDSQPYDYVDVLPQGCGRPNRPQAALSTVERVRTLCRLGQRRDMYAAFDYQAVANSFAIETAPQRYEVSVILAPAFQPQAGDETAVNRVQFRKSALDTPTPRRRIVPNTVITSPTNAATATGAWMRING